MVISTRSSSTSSAQGRGSHHQQPPSSRSTASKPLSFAPHSSSNRSPPPSSSSSAKSSTSSLSSLQCSLTSTVASKMKRAFGPKSSASLKNKGGSPGKDGSSPDGGGAAAAAAAEGKKKALTVGELMRIQMRVSEQADSRTRRALPRIAAGQVARPTTAAAWSTLPPSAPSLPLG